MCEYFVFTLQYQGNLLLIHFCMLDFTLKMGPVGTRCVNNFAYLLHIKIGPNRYSPERQDCK